MNQFSCSVPVSCYQLSHKTTQSGYALLLSSRMRSCELEATVSELKNSGDLRILHIKFTLQIAAKSSVLSLCAL